MHKIPHMLMVFILFALLSTALVPATAMAEETQKDVKVTVEPQQTLEQVSKVNNLSFDKLKDILGKGTYTPETTVQQMMDEKGVSLEQLTKKIYDLRLEVDLEGSKDWTKIMIKFILWAVFIILGMALLSKASKKKPLYNKRKIFLIAASLIFGFWLGSDPNPVGTINDALVLYGQKGYIFKPRMVALTIFLLTVVLGGRMLCGWGCQFGCLQEVFYQLPVRKYRLPFVISQSLRVIFFITITALALGWGFNLIELFDPFKIFSLQPIVLWGTTVFVAVILLLSIFIYRPWCQILCPFGLLAWLIEKISWFRIRVNHDTCVKCGLCQKVCPTGAMNGKHKGKSEIDCYNCSLCIDKCPVGAISYSKSVIKTNVTEKQTTAS